MQCIPNQNLAILANNDNLLRTARLDDLVGWHSDSAKPAATATAPSTSEVTTIALAVPASVSVFVLLPSSGNGPGTPTHTSIVGLKP